MVDQMRSKVLAETKFPQYVIQFFGAHLMRKGPTLDDLLILTSKVCMSLQQQQLERIVYF